MSSASKKVSSLVVAASMGAVEALKDQAGLCRWDYAFRSLYHRALAAKIHVGSLSQAVSSSSSRSGGARPSKRSEEERLHKAYHLICWGA